MLAPYDPMQAASSLLRHYNGEKLPKDKKKESTHQLATCPLDSVSEYTKEILRKLFIALSQKENRGQNARNLLASLDSFKPRLIAFDDYEGKTSVVKCAINTLQTYYTGTQVSKREKAEAITQLQKAAKEKFIEIDLPTGLILNGFAQVLKQTNRGKKVLQPLLQSFIVKHTPKLPSTNTLDEDLGIVVLLSGAETPTNREEQADFFLGVLTRFLIDYPFSACDNIHDVSWRKTITSILQPHLKKIAEKIGFPTPSETSEEEKRFFLALFSKLHQFLVLLNDSLQEGCINKTLLFKKINALRNDKLPTEGNTELLPIIESYLVQLLSKLLKVDESNSCSVFAIHYLANRLGKQIYNITQPNFVAALLKKLLNETLKTIEEAPSLSNFKAPDTEFSAKVGNMLYNIFQELMRLGNLSGCTSFVSSLASRFSSKENVGETFQQFLSRLAQSSSRLQLFYIVSLIFWKQEPELWRPYLDDLKEEAVDKEEISALIEKKLSSILSPKTDKTSSLLSIGITKCFSAFVNFDGSLPRFQKEIARVFTDILLSQDILIYFIIFMLEGASEHLNQQRNGHES